MNDKIRTILFTVAVTAVFAVLVSGVNTALADRIAANRTIAKQKVILGLFGLANEMQKTAEEQIPAFFSNKVTVSSDFNEVKIEAYRLKDGNSGLRVCSFVGQGFWDAIKGFIAVDLHSKEIRGIEFTQHGETPGLGGRISEPEFKTRFVGKPFSQIRSDGLRLKFVAEGSAKKADEIDGITGATGTTSALEKIVNQALSGILTVAERGTSR